MLEWEFDDEEHYPVKKRNRRSNREKIEKSKELFMKMNGRHLISDILPLLEKKGKKK